MNDVEEILLKLKAGDLIKIVWYDASLIKIAETKDPNLSNIVETEVEQIGQFIGIYRGKESGIKHLVMIVEKKDGKVVYAAIPLSLIIKISKGSKMRMMKRKTLSKVNGLKKKPFGFKTKVG